MVIGIVIRKHKMQAVANIAYTEVSFHTTTIYKFQIDSITVPLSYIALHLDFFTVPQMDGITRGHFQLGLTD